MQLTGVLCDKKVPIKLKDKVFKTVIKPTMTYGVLGGQKENRKQITCCRNEDAIKDHCQKSDHTRGCQSMPNVNIPETENIKLVWTHQEKRRRQYLKTNYGHACS